MPEKTSRKIESSGAFTINRDPQERDSKLGPIIEEAAREALRRVLARRKEQNVRFQRRCIHEMWDEQRVILLEQGIDWQHPKQLNPEHFFE